MGTHSKAKKAPVGGGDSKLDHVRNDRIKEIINVESRIVVDPQDAGKRTLRRQ